MYNIAVCYSFGEGLNHSLKLARKWMKQAADHGHSKAQFEHGLALFSVSIIYALISYFKQSQINKGNEKIFCDLLSLI